MGSDKEDKDDSGTCVDFCEAKGRKKRRKGMYTMEST